MFGRSSPAEPPQPAPKPQAAVTSPPAFDPPSASDAATASMNGAAPQPRELQTSVIGKDLRIAGDKIIIVCQSRLQVDGEIVGDLAGREVIIGETAEVKGAVSAETVEVRGRVKGTIKGRAVSLQKSARVDGEILHTSLVIAEGAQFDGRVRRARDDAEVTPQLELPDQG